MVDRQTVSKLTRIEFPVVIAIVDVLTCIRFPPIIGAIQCDILNSVRHTVAAETQLERFRAVSTDCTIRVRRKYLSPTQPRIVWLPC